MAENDPLTGLTREVRQVSEEQVIPSNRCPLNTSFVDSRFLHFLSLIPRFVVNTPPFTVR